MRACRLVAHPGRALGQAQSVPSSQGRALLAYWPTWLQFLGRTGSTNFTTKKFISKFFLVKKNFSLFLFH